MKADHGRTLGGRRPTLISPPTFGRKLTTWYSRRVKTHGKRYSKEMKSIAENYGDLSYFDRKKNCSKTQKGGCLLRTTYETSAARSDTIYPHRAGLPKMAATSPDISSSLQPPSCRATQHVVVSSLKILVSCTRVSVRANGFRIQSKIQKDGRRQKTWHRR